MRVTLIMYRVAEANFSLWIKKRISANFSHMEVTMVNYNHYAHDTISLTSKDIWGQRLNRKIKSLAKWPLTSLKWQNQIAIWYFNENEVIWNYGGHIGLKQPRNYKFNFGWAWAKSTLPHLNKSVDFTSNRSIKKHTNC